MDGIGLAKSQLEAFRNISAPNDPIKNFEVPADATVSLWQERLAGVTRESLVEEVATLAAEIKLPVLDRDEARYDHLKIYHQLSELLETLRSIAAIAVELGYPDALNVVAKTADITPQLNKILQLLNGLQTQTDKIAQQTATRISDGIAITLGPVSATLGAIRQSAALARQKIILDSDETNVGGLVSDLQRVANLANQIVGQLQTFSRFIPQWMRAALKGVVRLASEVADHGLELLRIVRHKKFSESGKHTEAGKLHQRYPEADEQALSVKEAKTAGAALRAARQKRKISAADMAHYLRIRLAHVNAIEEGEFSQLPGRTYAVGWVRAYAQALGIVPEEILVSVRRATPF